MLNEDSINPVANIDIVKSDDEHLLLAYSDHAYSVGIIDFEGFVLLVQQINREQLSATTSAQALGNKILITPFINFDHAFEEAQSLVEAWLTKVNEEQVELQAGDFTAIATDNDSEPLTDIYGNEITDEQVEQTKRDMFQRLVEAGQYLPLSTIYEFINLLGSSKNSN